MTIDNVLHKLWLELEQRLVQILVDEGCQCDEQHDFAEDSTSLGCLAQAALTEVKRLREEVFAAYVAGANMASTDDGGGEFDPESLRESFAKWLEARGA
jgi:hypothetical protein